MRRKNNSPRKFKVPCTVFVRHDWESLEAHLELEGDVHADAGDKIFVEGPPIAARFGESAVFHREATVIRAGWIKRQWTKLAARLELTELYEVSFSSRSLS